MEERGVNKMEFSTILHLGLVIFYVIEFIADIKK